jgi:hypothetical protein
MKWVVSIPFQSREEQHSFLRVYLHEVFFNKAGGVSMNSRRNQNMDFMQECGEKWLVIK